MTSELGRRGFGDGAAYQAARPSYPRQALEHLVERFAIDGSSTLVDLGAGTGKFTELLAATGARVIAVEPSASMRSQLAARLADVEVIDGSDVSIPLADEAADAVFVAQAFHWFDAAPALREMARVLRAHGGLGLIWNHRDGSVPWIRDLDLAIRWPELGPYQPGFDFAAVVEAGPFEMVTRHEVAHSRMLGHAEVIDLVGTVSYISVMEPDEREAILADVRSLLAPLPDELELRYRTEVISATKRR